MFSKNRFAVLSEYTNREIGKMVSRKEVKKIEEVETAEKRKRKKIEKMEIRERRKIEKIDPPIEMKSPEEVQKNLDKRASALIIGNTVWGSMPMKSQVKVQPGGDSLKTCKRVSFSGVPAEQSGESVADHSIVDLIAQDSVGSDTGLASAFSGDFGLFDGSGAEPLPRKNRRASVPTDEDLARSELEYAAQSVVPSSLPDDRDGYEPTFTRRGSRGRTPTAEELAASEAEFTAQFGSAPTL